MYVVRKQKMMKQKDVDGKTVYSPAKTYTVEECEDISAFMSEVVDTAQFRVRGWKYRLMEVVDSDDVVARFDWQKSSPTED